MIFYFIQEAIELDRNHFAEDADRIEVYLYSSPSFFYAFSSASE
jgi:hypothetical protein